MAVVSNFKNLQSPDANFAKHLEISSVQLMNSIEASVWIVSMNYIIKYVNPSLCRLFGYSSDEMIGQPVSEFVENQNLIIENMQKREKGIAESYSYNFRKKDGTPFQVLVAANAIFDSEQKVVGAMAVMTENKSAVLKNGSAHSANSEKSDFTLGNLQLHPSSIEYSINGERFEASLFSFKLLSYFVRNHDRVISRSEIIEHVWENTITSDRVIDAHIVAIRKKLKNFSGALKMVYGLGYILKAEATPNANV